MTDMQMIKLLYKVRQCIHDSSMGWVDAWNERHPSSSPQCGHLKHWVIITKGRAGSSSEALLGECGTNKKSKQSERIINKNIQDNIVIFGKRVGRQLGRNKITFVLVTFFLVLEI